MSVLISIKKVSRENVILPYFLGVVLSTLLLDYAFGSISLGIFVFYITVNFIIKKDKKLRTDFRLFLPILLILWFSITYFWSVDPKLTIKGIGRMLVLFVVPFTFMLIPKLTKYDLYKTLDIFTLSNAFFGGLFLLSALQRFLVSKNISEFTYHNLVSDFELNAIYVSVFYLICIFYLIGKKTKRLVDLLVLLFLIFMLFILASKMMIFAFFIGVFLATFFNSKIRKQYNSKFFTIIILGIGIVIFSSSELVSRVEEELKANFYEVLNKEKFNKVYPWTGSSFRLLQLRILGDQLKEENIFYKGFGLFASRENLKIRHQKYSTYKGYHTYNYHNCYAQVISESGIIGLLIFITTLLVNIIFGLKSRNYLFLLFALLMFFWGVTESYLWVQRGVFFFVIFYCIFNSIDFQTNSKKTNSFSFE